MKLFSKRPLSLILCILLGGFCFFVGSDNTVYLIATIAPLALIAIIFIFKDLFKGRRRIAVASLAAFALSVMLAFLWSMSFYPVEHYGRSVEAEGVVISADHSDTSHSTVIMRTDLIDGKRDRHTVRIVGSKDALSGINAGDVVMMLLTIDEIDSESRSYYTSLGYSACAKDPDKTTIIGHGKFTFRNHFDNLRDRVADRFRLVSNKATGDFLSALLTGDRDSIDPNTKLSFTRTGISHILALSGAHLVILAFAANTLLRLLRLNNKVRTVIVAILVVLYMLLTGLSACVTRAGVMLLVTSALYLISERSDGITSLSVSVFLIVCAQPYSVFDISLWLSAFATLGLIFLSTISRHPICKPSALQGIFLVLRNSVLASVFAISASFIFSILSFDSFSTLAVPATLLFAPLTDLLIYLGIIGLAVGGVFPMNSLLIRLTDTIKLIADVMAEPDFALVSFDFFILKVLGILLAVLFLALVVLVDKKDARKTVLMIVVVFLALNLSAIICSTAVHRDDGVIFTPSEQVDVMLIRSEGESALIASGSGKFTSHFAVNSAKEQKMLSVDSLILSSYHMYTVELITDTVTDIRVKTVYLPSPETTDEYVMAEIIAQKLSGISTDLKFYSYEDAVHIGDIAYISISRMQVEAKKSDDCFVLATDGHLLAYVSTDITDSYIADVTAVIHGCDTLIIGSRQGQITVLPKKASRVHLGYGATPSDKMIEYLDKKGASVSFTDAPTEFNFD